MGICVSENVGSCPLMANSIIGTSEFEKRSQTETGNLDPGRVKLVLELLQDKFDDSVVQLQ